VRALLYRSRIESSRVEFKSTWDARASRGTAAQVLRTICAFGNDIQNLNGGYIVIGVAEEGGQAVLPPSGLNADEVTAAQQWIRGNCNRIVPAYQPYLSPETVDGRDLLVVWAPGGDTRPYQAPETLDRNSERFYYIRQGADTVRAEGEMLRTLIQLTARIPHDDRRALNVPLEQVSVLLVRRHLQGVGSLLQDEPDGLQLLRQMRLTVPVNAHEAPRNVALLMFSDEPERWFPGARVEYAAFPQGPGGDLIHEHVFTGAIPQQVRSCLQFLRGIIRTRIEKTRIRPETNNLAAYPMDAVEEAVVNAVYHRSYDGEYEPVKVYSYPDRMQIVSYPGPVPGIEPHHFLPGNRVPPAPARNRRIGEFLKELRLAEGRGTGIGKIHNAMRANGSPPAVFEFNADRTYFSVTLPIHPGV